MNKIISIKGDLKPINIRYEDFPQGSKNSVLAIIGASLLFDSVQTISNFPDILDTRSILELLYEMKLKYKFTKGVFTKRQSTYKKIEFRENFFKTRGGFYIVAGIINKLKKIKIKNYVIGGCKIGDRNYQFIFNTFKVFGVDVKTTDDSIIFCKTADQVRDRIELNDPGIVVSGIAIILATQQKGTISLINISNAPEINDLIAYLNKNGVCVERHKKRELVICNDTSKKNKDVQFSIQDDRIVIATYIILCLISNGQFNIDKSKIKYLNTFISLLGKIGLSIKSTTNKVFICNNGKNILKPQNAIIDDYPSIPTDIQPLLTVLLCTIKGNSSVRDNIFPLRNHHVNQLKKLNQDIKFDKDRILIKGGDRFISNTLFSNDMRCSAALMLAASISEGTSKIHNFEDVNRGYEHLLRIIGNNRYVTFTTHE